LVRLIYEYNMKIIESHKPESSAITASESLAETGDT